MPLDYEVFERALTLFHRHSLQNDETVRQMQARGILPSTPSSGFPVLDLGAGEGHLPTLMRPYADPLVLVEPNSRCVEALRRTFAHVYPLRWGEAALHRLRADFPQRFRLVTMSHMLYHFDGIDDVGRRLRMAFSLVQPGGHLVVVINQPSAPTALIGIAFQVAEGRAAEAATNQAVHASCHDPAFYQELAGDDAEVAIFPIDTPIHRVANRDELIILLRMALLDPLSETPCDTDRLDAFLAAELDTRYPGLDYPATLPSVDDMIVIRKGAGG
jgi:SAM-dependent methyltransferase